VKSDDGRSKRKERDKREEKGKEIREGGTKFD
jgi:hypothetical protein